MPQLLNHIDYIGRQKQRDVLTIEFHNFEIGFTDDYRKNQARTAILAAFDENGIPYQECAGYASETRFDSYRGQIHIDVPFDRADPLYLKVEGLLENADGTMKFDTAWFRAYSLDYCMENAHHDVPGFWDRLMETF